MWFEPRLVSIASIALAPRAVLWEARGVTGGEPSDEALIYAVARGEREALALLYDRQAPLLIALGTRILARAADSRDAEDVLHDVFVEVWKHAGDFDPSRGSARAWLCLRMRSRCLDRMRSLSRRQAEPIDDAGVVGPDGLYAGPDAARVRQALERLSAAQREVLVLGYFQGLSSQEMADALHIPLGTVKSRVAGALTQLRSLLCEHAAQGVAS